MPGTVVFKVNSAGVRELLRGAPVQADLKARADRIAAAANADLTSGDTGFVVDVDIGKNRARAVVVTATPEAMNAEATSRTLTRSIDAGRG